MTTSSNEARNPRRVTWIKAARRDFNTFPMAAQEGMADALDTLVDGGMPDIAKPLTGLGTGVMELALKHRSDAFRVVCALQVGVDIWVIHAFQNKSKSGVKTPQHEIDLIRERLKRLREQLKWTTKTTLE
jgi:phage-related protein